ncbi:MAG TPA: SET domain-containing protein-lysine N-methyltransferase [Gaiellaceae bacterium]|nr:SET domain-containing protein-lysine N-methyltransferase [Gaiellaceae bacterium]
MTRRRSWLSPEVAVGPSEIEGAGLFARRAFAEGETVVVLGGTIIDDAELARLRPHSSLAVGEGVNLMQDDDDPAQYGNHSCDPNVWLADEVTLVTRRPVQAGEELTVDYGTMTVVPWGMECRCGTANCRGIVTGDDSRRPDLQERYAGRFSPFINARIAS